MKAGHPDRKNSGQVLIVTSLVVVLLLISTIIYVTETQKNAPIYHAEASTDFAAVKQAAIHTAISALANISNGGNPAVLADNLLRLKSVVVASSYSTIVDLDATTPNTTPYTNGVLLRWDTSGDGISSILMDIALNSSGNSACYYAQYSVNVISEIKTSSVYIPINGSQKQVNVDCTLFNEDKPAAAKNIEFYYLQDNPQAWVQATTPEIINYGNGTYHATFITQNTAQNILPISIHCIDDRAISIWTNTTSTLR